MEDMREEEKTLNPEAPEAVPAERPVRRRRSDRYRTESPEAGAADAPAQASETAAAPSEDSVRPAAEEADRPAPARKPLGDARVRMPVAADQRMSVQQAGDSRLKALHPSRIPPQARRAEAGPSLRRPAEVRRPTPGENLSPQNSGATLRVGYAPGRMGEGYTRQVRPAPERIREYPENRYAPAGQAGSGSEPPVQPERKPRRKRRAGLVALIVLLVLVLAVAGALLLLPKESGIHQAAEKLLSPVTGLLGGQKGEEEPERLITELIVTGNEDAVAPTDVMLSVAAAKQVTDLRLIDEAGMEMETVRVNGDNAEDELWMLTMHLDAGYTGTLWLQARTGDGDWQETGESFPVTVAAIPLPESAEEVWEEETEPEETLPSDLEVAVILTTATPTPEPTPEPTATPEFTETPEPTAEPTATPTPEPTPEPTATPPLTAEAAAEADPALIASAQVFNGSKKVAEYTRAAKDLIHMPVGGEYTKKPMGILTFRGDAFRQNAAQGTVTDPQLLEIAWRTEAGSARGASQTYYGISWTGQPAIVKWSKEVREKSNLYEAKIEKSGLKEVIIAGMDGVIYFLDLADGNLTRNSIKLGYPMKGSPSVHPSGYPFMTVGQFARKMKVKTGKIGLRQYNLYSGKELSLIDGLDGKLHRAFNDIGSFETSALIDRTSDTLITAGTNGLLYLVTLGSDFDYEAGVYKQSESNVVLKSKAKGEKKDSQTAVESSLAMYDRYVFYADMGGVLRCVDTNTMQTVWAVNTGDAVMAAVALDLTESRELNLYTGNVLLNRSKGAAQARCYDALSGAERWTVELPVKKNTKTKQEVGIIASPLIGQQGLSDLVWFTVTGLSEEGRSELNLPEGEEAALVALDKATGQVRWVQGLGERAESSPVAVYDSEGKGWVIQCRGDGEILLLEGSTGRVVHQLTVEGTIEASPAVYNDMMVIGTTGKGTSYIYGIQIK